MDNPEKGVVRQVKNQSAAKSWQLFLFVDVSIGLEHHASLLEI